MCPATHYPHFLDLAKRTAKRLPVRRRKYLGVDELRADDQQPHPERETAAGASESNVAVIVPAATPTSPPITRCSSSPEFVPLKNPCAPLPASESTKPEHECPFPPPASALSAVRLSSAGRPQRARSGRGKTHLRPPTGNISQGSTLLRSCTGATTRAGRNEYVICHSAVNTSTVAQQPVQQRLRPVRIQVPQQQRAQQHTRQAAKPA